MGCILYIQLPGIFWTEICRWQDTELKSLLLLFSPENRERMASWHTVLLSDGSKDWGHPANWTCLFHLFISTEFCDLVQRDVIDEETEVQRGEESCPGQSCCPRSLATLVSLSVTIYVHLRLFQCFLFCCIGFFCLLFCQNYLFLLTVAQ